MRWCLNFLYNPCVCACVCVRVCVQAYVFVCVRLCVCLSAIIIAWNPTNNLPGEPHISWYQVPIMNKSLFNDSFTFCGTTIHTIQKSVASTISQVTEQHVMVWTRQLDTTTPQSLTVYTMCYKNNWNHHISLIRCRARGYYLFHCSFCAATIRGRRLFLWKH